MVAINSTASTALAILKRAQPKDQIIPQPKPITTEPLKPASQARFAPGVADAILNLSLQANPTKLSDLPPEHAERLRQFGIDAAIRTPKPVVSDAEFQSIVMAHLSEPGGETIEGYREAIANGTVKIQRASDVEGLGYESIQYNLFKDGYLFGGAGWGTANMEFYNAQAAAGVRQGTGSINGLDYYITW